MDSTDNRRKKRVKICAGMHDGTKREKDGKEENEPKNPKSCRFMVLSNLIRHV
jgi:hypothetical protein